MSEQHKSTTHFGYKTVAANEKEQMVASVFHSVAAKYDIMNDLMSLVFIGFGNASPLIVLACAKGKRC